MVTEDLKMIDGIMKEYLKLKHKNDKLSQNRRKILKDYLDSLYGTFGVNNCCLHSH